MDDLNEKNKPLPSEALQKGRGAPFYDAPCPWLNSSDDSHSLNQQPAACAQKIPPPGYDYPYPKKALPSAK